LFMFIHESSSLWVIDGGLWHSQLELQLDIQATKTTDFCVVLKCHLCQAHTC
jgi:hypothetical protein